MIVRGWPNRILLPLCLRLPIKLQTWMTWRKYLEVNKCIYGNRWNKKNRKPRHNLPETCGGRKSVCLVWIRLTDIFLTHTRTTFWINEFWSNKYDTYKSTVNKVWLEKRTWRRFWTKQRNQLNRTSIKTQPAPWPQPYTILQRKQIWMYSLDTDHRKVSTTSEYKYQDQWTLML